VMPWRGSSGIWLRWTQKDRRFLWARGNKTLIDPQLESGFRRLEPIKNERGQRKIWDKIQGS
jgi:hypothetical protein